MYYFSLSLVVIVGCFYYIRVRVAMPCDMYMSISLLRLLRLRRQHVGDVLRVFPREGNVPKLTGQHSQNDSKVHLSV